ncbi:TonB-dependent receptor [Porphyromonadaceae bacterium]
MKRSLLLILISVITTFMVNAKDIIGTVVESGTKEPLMSATIGFINVSDTTKKYYNTTDMDGKFVVSNVPRGNYRMEITYVGFSDYKRNVEVTSSGAQMNVGTIQMRESAVSLRETVVEGRAIRATQTGDTVSYNADAFKTVQGSNAEDLLTKMPGVVVQNGTVQAQGEQVKKVLVDGKEFFEGDVTTALRNLPTEVVQSIEIFDRQSEQSQFSGFNDGNTTKTINVVTRNRKVEGLFGTFSAGYGTDGRYMSNLSFNQFNGEQRLSILGMSNNINQVNFSQDDLSGSGGMRRPGGGNRVMIRGGGGGAMFGGGSSFGFGQQSGVTNTHAGGINFNNNWNNKLTLAASYFISYADNLSDQAINRTYFDQSSGLRKYDELSNSTSKTLSHRINARMEWNIDTLNAILFYPQFTIQNTQSNYGMEGATTQSGSPLNSTINNSSADNNAINGGGMLMYRHRFLKPGRTISLGGNGRINTSNATTWQDAENHFFTNGLANDTAYSLRIPSKSPGWSVGANLVYTEPLSNSSMLMLTYNFNYNYTERSKRTYNILPTSVAQEELVRDLSSEYNTNYTTHSGGLGYRLNGKVISLTASMNFQRSQLNGDITYPKIDQTGKSFNSLLPFVMLDYKINSANAIRMFLRTSTNSPSITQLQSVIDNSNPLMLSTGNPNLDQEYMTMGTIRYTYTNKNGHTLVAMIGGSNRMNYVGDSTFVAQEDMKVGEDIVLRKGSQFSKPMNMDGYWSVNSMLTYGFPITAIKSNMNLNMGANYNRMPGVYNGKEQVTNSWSLSPGFVLSSNISNTLDFTLSYNANYYDAKNNLLPNANTTYLNQRGNFKFNWILWKGFTLESNLTYSGYSGMSADTYDQSYFLWNASVGKKFLKNNAGEIKFTVFDMLKQNKSINRNTTTTYYEDVIANVMPQYFMVSFTYQLRNIKGMMGNAGMGNSNRGRSFDRGPGMMGPGGPPPGGPGMMP